MGSALVRVDEDGSGVLESGSDSDVDGAAVAGVVTLVVARGDDETEPSAATDGGCWC